MKNNKVSKCVLNIFFECFCTSKWTLLRFIDIIHDFANLLIIAVHLFDLLYEQKYYLSFELIVI